MYVQQYKSLINYTLFGLCITFAAVCSAVGFGDIKLYSYLNEPLSAELEILNLNGISPNQLIVNLASDKDFVRAGLAKPYFLSNLQFQIVGYEGKVYIYISSTKVVTTPYLEFLLELSWPDGSLIKDYTLLVNPPPKNLTAATRPVPLSQIAAKEFANAEFGAKQQPTDTTTTKNMYKPQQTSFSDESEYIEEQEEAAAKIKPVVADANAEATEKSTEVAKPEIAQNKINYEKRLQELKRQEEAKLAEKAQASKEGNLGKVIDVLKDVQEVVEPTTDVAKLSNIRNKNTDMFKDVEESASDEDIDFGDVIKPSAAVGAAATPAAPVAPVQPGKPPLPAEQNMGIMLLLIGFALGLTGAAAFVVKKGYHRKIFAAKNKPEVDEETDEDSGGLQLDDDIEMVERQESRSYDDLDLNYFEDELDKLDLDNIMVPDKQPKSVTDIFNVTESVTSLPVPTVTTLTPEEEAINLKINLAKQYLDAKDKESAKAILEEVIATAKDAQKLEAEILLSGIV